jgi:hypothetical protein
MLADGLSELLKPTYPFKSTCVNTYAGCELAFYTTPEMRGTPNCELGKRQTSVPSPPSSGLEDWYTPSVTLFVPANGTTKMSL